MALVTYRWELHHRFTVRYEEARDRTLLARLHGDFLTLAYGYEVSRRSMLQLEYILPDVEARDDSGGRNPTDIADDLVQLNYRLSF
jgi:hypothetical protein